MNNNLIKNLAVRVKAGDYEAFENLFNQCYKTSCYVANAILYDIEASRDIAQDVFVKLWENRKKIDESKDITQLIYISVKNKAKDLLRKQYTKSKYSSYITNQTNEAYSMFDSIERDEIHSVIENCIESLPKKTRIVYKLKALRGKSTKEITHQFGIPKQTINWHLAKVRQELSLSLDKYFS